MMDGNDLTKRIGLLERWGAEAPELVDIDWPWVISLLVRTICRTFPPATADSILGCSSQTAADFASAAIAELLAKPRWNEEIELNAMNVFKLARTVAINDVLDRAFRRRNGKRVSEHPVPLELCGNVADPCASAEDAMIRAEGSDVLRKLEEALRLRPDTHVKFPDYLDLIVTTDGDIRRADIALILGVPPVEVDKMQKRLKRRLRNVVPPERLRRRRANNHGGIRG
jgi:DNA-directed RNA polymerase specialized sigma24 family protein